MVELLLHFYCFSHRYNMMHCVQKYVAKNPNIKMQVRWDFVAVTL